MSVHRLQVEQELRAVEDELAAEEARQLREVRAEAASYPPRPRRRVPHRTTRLVLLAKDGRSLAARHLLDWWAKRKRHGGDKRPVTTNEINRLAAILRRLQ